MLCCIIMMEEQEHVAPRREFCHFAPERANVVHCYGVDFLSTKEVLEAFRKFGTKEVEWLDDSSCNIVFGDDVMARDVIKALAPKDGVGPQDEHWTRTMPLKLGAGESKQGAKAKAKSKQGAKVAAKEAQFLLRIATEADRKDPGHSGHTDSVYYAHVKEQQALSKQSAELRREKKRARRRVPSTDTIARLHQQATATETVAGAAVVSPAVAGATCSASSGAPAPDVAAMEAESIILPPAKAGSLATPGAPKIGFRGLLDPLLFLRAPGGGDGGASSAPVTASSAAGGGDVAGGAPGDLREMLQRAEAEYAAVQTTATSSTASVPATSPVVSGAPVAGNATGAGARGRNSSKGPGKGGQRGRDATPSRGGRQRDRTPGTPGGRQRDRTPGTPGGRNQEKAPPEAARGKKRRPVEQEPRAVSDAPAPARRAEALPAVEAFLKEHRVRCQRYTLNRTFRGILFGQQQKKKRQQGQLAQQAQKAQKASGAPANASDGAAAGGDTPGSATKAESGGNADTGGDAKMAVADEPMAESSLSEAADKASKAKKKAPPVFKEDLPPWDQYMRANNFFTKQGHFMHTIAWQAGNQKVYTVVPHPTRVNLDKLARATQVPRERIRQRKLKEISDDTGFPVFICPPIGFRPDAAGKMPMLLVDSAVTEYKKPLLFDCGSVGLSIPSPEFLRSTGAACIEGLGEQPPEAKGAGVAPTAPLAGPGSVASARAASPAKSAPEPAPEPAPAPSEVSVANGAHGDVVPMST